MLLDTAALALRQVAGLSPQTQKACLSTHAYVRHATTQACASTVQAACSYQMGATPGSARWQKCST